MIKHFFFIYYLNCIKRNDEYFNLIKSLSVIYIYIYRERERERERFKILPPLII